MKRILLIVLPAILVLGTLVGVVVVLRGKGKQSAAPNGAVPATQEEGRMMATRCAPIEDVGAHDECVYQVAILAGKIELCEESKEPARAATCRDRVTLKLARDTNDISLCGTISSETITKACLTHELGSGTDRAVCTPFTDRAKENCLALVITNQALKEDTIALCDEIVDPEFHLACSDRVEEGSLEYVPLDSDGDGLSDAEERKLGTHPNVADTDGDGFPDGAEVRGGYNPLGAGRL